MFGFLITSNHQLYDVNTCDIPLLLKCDVIAPARKSRLPSWRLEAGCILSFHRRITQQCVDMSHCSLLKAVRPEEPNGASPFLFFRGLCPWRPFLWHGSSAVILSNRYNIIAHLNVFSYTCSPVTLFNTLYKHFHAHVLLNNLFARKYLGKQVWRNLKYKFIPDNFSVRLTVFGNK
jgi:hypothetical protein